jgi:hypothetical protein
MGFAWRNYMESEEDTSLQLGPVKGALKMVDWNGFEFLDSLELTNMPHQ